MTTEVQAPPIEKIALLYTLVAKYQLHMNLCFTAEGYYDSMQTRQRKDAHYVTLATEALSPPVRITVVTRNRRTAEEAIDDAIHDLVRQLPNEELLDAYRTAPADT